MQNCSPNKYRLQSRLLPVCKEPLLQNPLISMFSAPAWSVSSDKFEKATLRSEKAPVLWDIIQPVLRKIQASSIGPLPQSANAAFAAPQPLLFL
jgi:hypothetical protein